jgi:hypothetical protein
MVEYISLESRENVCDSLETPEALTISSPICLRLVIHKNYPEIIE